jgi:transcriptional regulator with XRE-family HTH domain
MTDENYGQQIKKLRIDLGMTQNEVAEALNVTPGYICNVENGRTAMSLRILIYFAKLTGVTLDSLVGRIDNEYQNTALDNEIYERIQHLDENTKMKILKTLKLWEKPLLNPREL